MRCGYLKCDIETGVNKKNGTEKKYCCPKHSSNEHNRRKKEKRNKGFGNASGYSLENSVNVAEEAFIENIKHMEQALKGNSEAQEALKVQGLTYHFNSNHGEWGEERVSL